MFSREFRPLRRPKLGIPDYYPQDEKQREDELTYQTLNCGFKLTPPVDQQDEIGSALKDFSQHLLNPKEYVSRITNMLEAKRRTGWVQDSQKRKVQVSKENFFPVSLGRNRKEIAAAWFQDLASTKSLSSLSKKVPVFNKKEEIFDYLCEKDVPVFRAAWYIKMTAAYTSTMTDSKLNKKKQFSDPSYDWTVSLTKYMQECVWRICNESTIFGRQDSHSSSRHPSVGSVPQTPAEEGLTEVNRWQYMMDLSSWLYQENLLDNHEFLRWLVDRLEQVKTKDTKSLQLYLPLVLKHLLSIGNCVTLARPLISYCCQRLATFYELEQKLQKLQPAPAPTPTATTNKTPDIQETMETNEEDDKDSVFNEPAAGGVTIKQEPQEPQEPKPSACPHPQEDTATPVSHRTRSTGGGDKDVTSVSKSEEKPSHFHWCAHHSSLMLQLCCIIQTIAIRCPTAFVCIKGYHHHTHRSLAGSKGTSPINLLPVGLTELPMPLHMSSELRKKVLPALAAAEQEIHQRNKASEAGWSSMTVADLQTTSEGSNIQKVLKILDLLDLHVFNSSRAHNPLSTLYSRISAFQKAAEVPLGDNMLVMLLCQWAVTFLRAGGHRPLVVARLLRQRQNDIIKGEGWRDDHNLNVLDESWDESNHSGDIYPFQAVLFKFLDTRAPLPDDLSAPLQSTDPFFQLVVLFSELIHLNVFSYTMYLSTLIARGEIKSPIIPLLPFARDSDTIFHNRPKPEPEPELSLTISLPALKKPRLDNSSSLMQSASLDSSSMRPPSPGGFVLENTFSSALDNLGLMSNSGPSLQVFQQESNVDENAALMQERAHKLERLLGSDSLNSSQLVSPLSFNSQDCESAPSPLAPSKSDPFNFSLPFPSTSSLFMDEDQTIDPTVNKQAFRHLLFATYFPISDSHLTKQELNERAVVLCGVGKMRNKVERIIRKVTVDVEHYFRLLSGISTPVLPKLADLMQRFRALPIFEQWVLATTCEKILRSSLLRPGSGSDTGIAQYPACAQLVFVCELLEISGGIRQILSLLVDIIACNQGGEKEEEKESFEVHRPPPPLPSDLCFPVTCLLQKYYSYLLLSQQDTCVVFEGLCRVLEGLHSPVEITSYQKAVFLFLHKLYTNCTYLQRTYRHMFGPFCLQLRERQGVLTGSYSPTTTDQGWQRTMLLINIAKPSECSIPLVCGYIKNSGYPSYPKTVFIFVTDVFSSACQKSINCQTLCDLAHVCAEVCCVCGPMVNRELMGAFRALCLPMNVMKSCQTGFSALTNRTNILMDPGIHSNLVTFVALLITNGCFLLHDIIIYIIKPIIRVQLMHPQGSSQHSTLSLEFVSSLILHLLVDEYINGHHAAHLEHPVLLPPFVRHFLQGKSRELDFSYIISLLKDLLRISQPSTSRGTTVGSVKTGMQILVQSVPSVSDGNESAFTQVRTALETVASQDWVREKCIQLAPSLLDSDKLGDTSLTPSQARYLLNLLSPYTASGTLTDTQIHTTDSNTAVEHILKNLDQWTLRNALLHINIHITQASPAQVRIGLLEHLAGEVIRVFEDSCGDEWLGQTIECCVESGDGAYSPSVWLVTPLISLLQQNVLGRVLKSAGNVLGQGQWWNPEKSQEKRRSTRATSGVAPPKTGLQWQQPFLELVLACMHAQTTHEELLGPLKTQLSTFLAAFEKEGLPSDEQSKTMLYAALKLRLSLVGSMLGSICVNEATTLEWVPLLMQLICSGAVDRQTDTSELFTNCLDMLCTLFLSLPMDFHFCLASGGEELGRKVYIACIKKLKAELANVKSACFSEIQQLFPLTQKSYDVITVRQPAFSQPKGGTQNTTERIKGLRVQDTREISPWDILEGTKHSGPLMLSWFGAIRMKRKPLKYEEQTRIVRFHSHQNRHAEMMYKVHNVILPDLTPVVEEETPVQEGDSNEQMQRRLYEMQHSRLGIAPHQEGDSKPIPMPPTVSESPAPDLGVFPRPTGPTVPAIFTNPPGTQVARPLPGVPPPQRPPMMNEQMRRRLYQIEQENKLRRGYMNQQIPGMMQRSRFGIVPHAPVYSVVRRPIQVPAGYTLQQHQQRARILMQMQQQQRAAAAMNSQHMLTQYGPQVPYRQVQMRPMQANPPVPMQQVMQHGYPPQQQHMIVRPTQQQMQYQQQPAPGGMNPMHRQIFYDS